MSFTYLLPSNINEPHQIIKQIFYGGFIIWCIVCTIIFFLHKQLLLEFELLTFQSYNNNFIVVDMLLFLNQTIIDNILFTFQANLRITITMTSWQKKKQ